MHGRVHPPRRLRFGLASTFVVLAVAAFIFALVGKHVNFQKTISRVGGVQGFCGYNGSHDLVLTEYYDDHRDRPVALVFCVFDAFDPDVPAIRRDYLYDSNRGGQLEVDGNPVSPHSHPRLFVNGPFGYTVAFKLDEAELRGLKAERSTFKLREYWRTKIEPRLYDTVGNMSGGLRHGPWTYRLIDGPKYLDANYKLGERDGVWTNYYPDGTIRTVRMFDEGEPIGEWKYFDARGEALGYVEWEQGCVRGPIKGKYILGGSGSWRTKVPSGKTSGHQFTKAGGEFIVEGKTVPRPPIPARWLTPRQFRGQ